MTQEDLAAIDEVARVAARRHVSRLLPFAEKVEAARDGIIDAMIAGDTDWYAAAFRGISRAVTAELGEHGFSRDGYARRHAVYWHGPRLDDPFDDMLEKIAIRQVWAALDGRHRDALVALADAGFDVEVAAEGMGVSLSTFASRLERARRAARELWHAPETPSRHYGRAARRGRVSDRVRALRVRLSARKYRHRREAA